MAASTSLYRFSDNLLSNWGVGNGILRIGLLIAGALSLCALTGLYFPALAASLGWLVQLSIFSGTFLGISLLTVLNPLGMLFGAVTGLILASLSSVVSSLVLLLAPPLTVALLLPNVIAAGAGALGFLCSVVEGICCSTRSSYEPNPPGGFMRSYAAEQPDVSENSEPQYSGERAFFDRSRYAAHKLDINQLQASDEQASNDETESCSMGLN
jgi:hypothetical protein